MNFPKHIILSIQHNQHKRFYQPIQEYFDNNPILESGDSIEKQKCIEEDSIWEIQWYPRTPIGFNYVFSSTFERALELMNQTVD